MVESDRPQMAKWRMCIACWIPKATNTHYNIYYLLLFHCNNDCPPLVALPFSSSFDLVGPLPYPYIGYGFFTHNVRNKQCRRNACTIFLSILGAVLSDIPRHFRTVCEQKITQMAYRSLSSHVRPATDIRICC